jgi:putative PIN family toxin of toxin-antitoxin system
MSGLRRVVFDTSTLVSALLRPETPPYQALFQAFGSADVCASLDTLAELERVLKRKKFNGYLDSELRLEFAAMLCRNSRMFEVPESVTFAVRPACRDVHDNKFLALAAVAGANVIVSSDDDLLVLHPWHELPILSPADFVAAIALGLDTREDR